MKKIVRVFLTIFALALVLAFFLLFVLLNVFLEFNLISAYTLLYVTCIFSLAIATVCASIALIIVKSEKKTKLGNWLSNNIAKFMLGYTLLTVFLYSIRSEVLLDFDGIKEIVSLGWTIFGISVAIFLIWNVIVIEYLEKKKPIKPDSKLPTKITLYIQTKADFYSSATMLLNNVSLLLVNLMALVLSTVYIHVAIREATILTQSLSFLSLLLCTNSLVGLFLDILRPFNEKAKKILKATKVTKKEIELQNEITKQTDIVLKVTEVVENMKNIDEVTKSQVISGIIESYINKFADIKDEKAKVRE